VASSAPQTISLDLKRPDVNLSRVLFGTASEDDVKGEFDTPGNAPLPSCLERRVRERQVARGLVEVAEASASQNLNEG
jgi:hypothetical protein